MRKFLAWGLVYLSVVPPTFAQVIDERWNQLAGLQVGTKLQLIMKDGSEIEGRFVAATADTVVMKPNRIRKGIFVPAVGETLRDAVTFRRADVASTELVTRKSAYFPQL